jgi:2-C-methyl-D-erythritol 4-phosphate cytidylyltransferase
LIEPFVVILPGAGSGLRFNSDTPKQFQKIEGKLVIDYSIDLFLSFKECKKIIIALPDIHLFDKKIFKQERIKIIEGGDSRADSVREGFNVLMSLGHKENILIHDVARPCLQSIEVKNFLNFFSTSKADGVIFAKPSTDTLKSSKDGKVIDNTVDRSLFWEAQTPQIFNSQKLFQAYNSFGGDLSKITDESSLFDNKKENILLFKGSSNNMKITYPGDLQLAEHVIMSSKE